MGARRRSSRISGVLSLRRSGLILALVALVVGLSTVGLWSPGAPPTPDDPPAAPAERAAGSEPAGSDVAPPTPGRTPDYRFLSSPDFLNTDLADLRRLPRWRAGMPNSWNRDWARSLGVVMDTFAGEEPDDVLVAGDLVNGHWGHSNRYRRSGDPRWDYGVLGPTDDEPGRRASVRRAAAAYYGQWLQRFASRSLDVHVAVGDHEIGDNSWQGFRDNYAAFKRRNIDLFKSEFSDRVLRPDRYRMRPPGPASDTAYATYLSADVLMVTVDVFQPVRGDVVARLDAQQLAWLDDVLARAKRRGVEWTVVQGHTPVAGPVRRFGSSALMYQAGTTSRFWETMVDNDVDLYLSGEVHDVTAIHRDGITQISHGGLAAGQRPDGKGGTNYLLGEVYGDRMYLRDNRFEVGATSDEELWQPSPWAFPPALKEFLPDPPEVGSMVLGSDNEVLYRDGLLDVYDPSTGD